MTKRFIVLFGLMVFAGGVNADPLVSGDMKAGQQKSAVCAACHGPKGNMVSPQFPKLAGQGSPYIYEQLKLFKSGERKNAIMMGQAAGLSDQDMKDLAVYFASQQTRPGASDVTIAPAGAAIYHGGIADKDIPACSGCHGPSGVGNAAAKFPRLSGQNSPYIVAQLTAYRDGTRSGYRNATIMNGVAQNLSDTDIKALASYVAGLSPAQGGKRQQEYGALMQGASTPDAPSAGKTSDTKGAKSGSDNGDNGSADQASSESASDSSNSAGKQKDGTDQTAKQAVKAPDSGASSSASSGGNASTEKNSDSTSSQTSKSGGDSGQQSDKGSSETSQSTPADAGKTSDGNSNSSSADATRNGGDSGQESSSGSSEMAQPAPAVTPSENDDNSDSGGGKPDNSGSDTGSQKLGNGSSGTSQPEPADAGAGRGGKPDSSGSNPTKNGSEPAPRPSDRSSKSAAPASGQHDSQSNG